MADATTLLSSGRPQLVSVVLDAEHARSLAEFYRELLGWTYRTGDEPPSDGSADTRGNDWLVLFDPHSSARLAVQQVEALTPSTWPGTEVPQQLHLDLVVDDAEQLAAQHARALQLGARVLLDRSADPDEALWVYADPAGHPFCIFVSGRQPEAIVRAAFAAYLSGDREAADPLYADDFRFTSPNDDHIDKSAFFERCFPTADRVVSQRFVELVGFGGDRVFVNYEYVLTTGEQHRNTELITVRDGQITEVQVYFGGRF